MPANVVRSKREERLWERAKKVAEKQGRAKDWPYVTGIFVRMTGGRKDLEKAAWLDRTRPTVPPQFSLLHWPGQVPGREGMELVRLVETPALPPTEAAMLDDGRPIDSPLAVVRGLGLRPVDELDWVRFVKDAVKPGTAEPSWRPLLIERARQLGLDPLRRCILLQRAIRYWRGGAGLAKGWNFYLEGLEKGASHKYLKRLANASPPPNWRYIYGYASKHHERDLGVGDKIQLRDGKKRGHFEVVDANQDGTLRLRHDETGKEHNVSRSELHDRWLAQHGRNLKKVHARLRKLVQSASKFGTVEQKHRAARLLAQSEHAHFDDAHRPQLEEPKPEPLDYNALSDRISTAERMGWNAHGRGIHEAAQDAAFAKLTEGLALSDVANIKAGWDAGHKRAVDISSRPKPAEKLEAVVKPEPKLVVPAKKPKPKAPKSPTKRKPKDLDAPTETVTLEQTGDHIWGSRKDLAHRRIVKAIRSLSDLRKSSRSPLVDLPIDPAAETVVDRLVGRAQQRGPSRRLTVTLGHD